MKFLLAILLLVLVEAGAMAQVRFNKDLSASLPAMQFVDRIVRPCASGNVVQATVIANPNNTGDVAVTTCQGGNFTINGSTIVPGSGLADPGANGYVVRTALNTTVARTLTGTTNQVIISNGTGVAGNSVFSLPQSIATSSTPRFASLGLNTAGGTAGQLKFGGTTSGVITMHPAAIAGTWDWTLPIDGGTNGFFLQTNGAGVTTWAAAAAGLTCAGCTNNKLPKTTGVGTLGDSRLSDNGTIIDANSAAGTFQAGDTASAANGSFLKIDDAAKVVQLFADDVNTGSDITLTGGAAPQIQLTQGNGIGQINLTGDTQSFGSIGANILFDQSLTNAVIDVSELLPSVTGTTNLGSTGKGFKQAFFDATITAGGTTGPQTINKSAGSVNFALGDTSLLVTSNKVTANSIVMCTVATNDAQLKSVQCVPTAGSFTMFGNAAAAAETRVNFWILNQ